MNKTQTAMEAHEEDVMHQENNALVDIYVDGAIINLEPVRINLVPQEFLKWLSRYREQGYYFDVHQQRIPVDEVTYTTRSIED